MDNLEKFFEEDLPKQVLEDMEKTVEERKKLHSAAPEVPLAKPLLGGLGPPGRRGSTSPTLASLPGVPHFDLVKQIAGASNSKRAEIFDVHRPKLYAIVYANYRPGPAYFANHELSPSALGERIAPGKGTWREMIGAYLPSAASLARQCCRLDRQGGPQSGSGFLLPDGRVLTNRHVIEYPGYLFGNPPDASNRPATLQYAAVKSSPHSAASNSASFLFPADGELDAALLDQVNGWQAVLAGVSREFHSMPGLPLRNKPLSAEELAGRYVAVIGHPLVGNEGGTLEDQDLVFGDAPLGLKRFMPGRIDEKAPLVEEAGQSYINHDCSTLGGASGSCLVDLQSGEVLGIHCAGNAKLKNRAVPAWRLP